MAVQHVATLSGCAGLLAVKMQEWSCQRRLLPRTAGRISLSRLMQVLSVVGVSRKSRLLNKTIHADHAMGVPPRVLGVSTVWYQPCVKHTATVGDQRSERDSVTE